jgi:recombination protein RecR
MAGFAGPVQELIDELGRLPGIGPKSAQRIAYHLLKRPKDDALRLARAITASKERVVFCGRCFNVAELTGELSAADDVGATECSICRDERRNAKLLCVVEEPKDIVAVERTREFDGRYHVLQGAINHLEDIVEVILCTNPNIDGEATAMYLARLFKPLGIPVSRIASGLPVGGDLEYADELTLGRALEGRRSFSG